MNGRDDGLPIEHFIQALSSQLDRAQQTMALKARAGLPMTFAVKDLTLDLRTHVEMSGAEVRIRPAGPGEVETSVLHLALTTITRPMMEENTRGPLVEQDEQSLADVLPDVSADERRRLEWAGIQTVAQLRQVERSGGEDAIRRVSDLPVDRLRAALARASQPAVLSTAHVPDGAGDDSDQGSYLRISGRNLVHDGLPAVRMGGASTDVVNAHERELLVRLAPHQRVGGLLEVEPRPGVIATSLVLGSEPAGGEP